MKAAKLFAKWFRMMIQEDMIYRANFFIMLIAHFLWGFWGPLIGFLIYNVSDGIPGWTFEQFLLLTGTGIIVFGLYLFTIGGFSWKNIYLIRHGNFDLVMIRPYSPLTFQTLTSSDPKHIFDVFLGIAVISYAALNLNITLANLMLYILFLIIAVSFLYSMNIMISAVAFLVVKSDALLQLFFNILNIGDFPLTIYGNIGYFFFSFIFPIGLATFYPAQVLLGRVEVITMLQLVFVALVFYASSLYSWKLAMKKYSSAGG